MSLPPSRGVDISADTSQAVAAAWDGDREMLQSAGYDVGVLRERPGAVASPG